MILGITRSTGHMALRPSLARWNTRGAHELVDTMVADELRLRVAHLNEVVGVVIQSVKDAGRRRRRAAAVWSRLHSQDVR